MSNLLILSSEDVESIVSDLNPKDLQLLSARLFSQFHVFQLCSRAANKNDTTPTSISMPQRLTLPMPNHTALFMPARITSSSISSSSPIDHPKPGNTAIKVVCVPHDATRFRGIPATTMVLDENTGNVKAIVNATKLTPLRNAAGSLLSTSLLATSQPDSIVVFGAGQQIDSHLDLHLRHFPSLKHCTIVNRSKNDRALSLRKKISDKFTDITVDLFSPAHNNNGKDDGEGALSLGNEVKNALGRADIIICATSSTIPLFPSSYVKDGTHIILIGSYKPEMKEVDRDLISRSLKGTLLVDSTEACLCEAGELIDASVQPGELTELGQLLPVDSQGDLDERAFDRMLNIRRPRNVASEGSFEGPVSIFKSVGLGIQDVAIAAAIVEKALDSNGRIGTVIPNYD